MNACVVTANYFGKPNSDFFGVCLSKQRRRRNFVCRIVMTDCLLQAF
jgi:hypothetical protein